MGSILGKMKGKVKGNLIASERFKIINKGLRQSLKISPDGGSPCNVPTRCG